MVDRQPAGRNPLGDSGREVGEEGGGKEAAGKAGVR